MRQLLILFAVAVLLAACGSAVSGAAPNAAPDGASGSGSGSATGSGGVDPADAPYLPNAAMTPGATLDVTPRDICAPGYSSKVRDVPTSVKDQVYREYGIASHKPGEYEVDHLISLELGGSNSIRNLWPEPYQGQWNAHIKDRLENKLHDMICSNQIDLASAQRAIATDWVAAYRKYVGQ